MNDFYLAKPYNFLLQLYLEVSKMWKKISVYKKMSQVIVVNTIKYMK